MPVLTVKTDVERPAQCVDSEFHHSFDMLSLSSPSFAPLTSSPDFREVRGWARAFFDVHINVVFVVVRLLLAGGRTILLLLNRRVRMVDLFELLDGLSPLHVWPI